VSTFFEVATQKPGGCPGVGLRFSHLLFSLSRGFFSSSPARAAFLVPPPGDLS